MIEPAGSRSKIAAIPAIPEAKATDEPLSSPPILSSSAS
jgi:hypothetical protein